MSVAYDRLFSQGGRQRLVQVRFLPFLRRVFVQPHLIKRRYMLDCDANPVRSSWLGLAKIQQHDTCFSIVLLRTEVSGMRILLFCVSQLTSDRCMARPSRKGLKSSNVFPLCELAFATSQVQSISSWPMMCRWQSPYLGPTCRFFGNKSMPLPIERPRDQ